MATNPARDLEKQRQLLQGTIERTTDQRAKEMLQGQLAEIDSRIGAPSSITGEQAVVEAPEPVKAPDMPELKSPEEVGIRTTDQGQTIVYDPEQGKGRGFLVDSEKGKKLLETYGLTPEDVMGKNTVGFGGERISNADTIERSQEPTERVMEDGTVIEPVRDAEGNIVEQVQAAGDAKTMPLEVSSEPTKKPGEEVKGDVLPVTDEVTAVKPEMTQEEANQEMADLEFFTGAYGAKEGPEVKALEDNATKATPEQLQAAREAFQNGTLNKDEYKRYLERVSPSAEEKIVEGVSNEIDYTKPADIQSTEYLNSFPSSSGSEFASSMSALGDPETMSSAEFMTQMVAQMKMENIDENLMISRTIFDNARKAAVASYEATINAGANAIAEIDAIDRGVSEVATTAKSLAVRIAKQSKDLSTASIEAREGLLSMEYEVAYSNMVEQNARLEGYMKAKLNYMGAATSSAGLTLMATTINKAQQNLLLLNGRFTAEMTQLELKKAELMQGYHNAVTEQLISVDASMDSASATLGDKLDEIDANQLASEAEASTLRLTALSDLAKDMYKIKTDQKEWEWKLYTDQWDMAMEETKFVNDLEQQAKKDAQANLNLMLQAGMGKSLGQLPADMQEAMLTMAAISGLPESYVSQALATQRQKLYSGVKKAANNYGVKDSTATYVADIASAVISGDMSPDQAGAAIAKLPSAERVPAKNLYEDTYATYAATPYTYFGTGPASFMPEVTDQLVMPSAEGSQDFFTGFITGKEIEELPH